MNEIESSEKNLDAKRIADLLEEIERFCEQNKTLTAKEMVTRTISTLQSI